MIIYFQYIVDGCQNIVYNYIIPLKQTVNYKRNGMINLSNYEPTHEQILRKLSESMYYKYVTDYDAEHGTNHAERSYEWAKIDLINKKKSADEPTRVEHDGKRNVIGNYSNNAVVIEKTFSHLNSLKRSMSLSFQSDDENTRLLHENNMFRELLNLELSLRTMKTNIKRENENS